MRNKQLVIYDMDKLYAFRLQQFLSEREGNYFETISFSDRNELEKMYARDKKIKPEILLVAERSFYEDIVKLGAKHLFILNETGLKNLSQFVNLNKYQNANLLFQEILLEYADKEENFIPRFCGNKKAKIVGIYTPVNKCLQTGFSFTLAQCLGKKGKTLYINFEQYSGFSQLFQKGYIRDLSDLVYYFSYSRDKFLYWIDGVVEHYGSIDYIPPIMTATSLAEVSGQVWLEMFETISKDTEYEYIVLDLNENVQGIFQILDLSHIVYTITKTDVISTAKLGQFMEILKESKYSSLQKKIKYLGIPKFALKDMSFEEMLHGELWEYTERLCKEDFYES